VIALDTGRPLYSHLPRLLMEQAASDLARTSRSIGQIGERAGLISKAGQTPLQNYERISARPSGYR
jgi:hypothetical protein